MNKIPTAEQFLKEKGINNKLIEDILVEFAKLHVKAALESAAKKCDNEIEKDFINDELILNAYPESNIK